MGPWLKHFGLSQNMTEIGDSFTDASLCLDAAIAGQGVMLAWQTVAEDALNSGRLVEPFPERSASGYVCFNDQLGEGGANRRSWRAAAIWPDKAEIAETDPGERFRGVSGFASRQGN